MTETAAPATWTATATIEQALAYNGAEPDWTAADASAVREGAPVLVATTQAPGNGYTVTISVFPAVRMANGLLAGAADPVTLRLRLKRGMTSQSAGQWWARKCFGRALPIEVTSYV